MSTTATFFVGLLVGAVVAALAWALLRCFFWRRDQGDSVPVSIDALREIDGQPMIRATYFIASADRPHVGWAVMLRLLRPPMRMLGESGIIYRPALWSSRFRTAAQIDHLIDSIEQHSVLTVEIEDLWLPQGWFAAGRTPVRGDVYRAPIVLFERAYRFRNGEIGVESLLSAVPKQAVTLSAEETQAFRDWADQQIAASRVNYEQTGSMLRYTPEST